MKTKSLRTFAVGALTAAALTFSTGSIAAAVEDGATENPSVGIENIDRFANGVIDIHKKLNPDKLGDAATGDEVADVSGKPLNGVTFSAYPVLRGGQS